MQVDLFVSLPGGCYFSPLASILYARLLFLFPSKPCSSPCSVSALPPQFQCFFMWLSFALSSLLWSSKTSFFSCLLWTASPDGSRAELFRTEMRMAPYLMWTCLAQWQGHGWDVNSSVIPVCERRGVPLTNWDDRASWHHCCVCGPSVKHCHMMHSYVCVCLCVYLPSIYLCISVFLYFYMCVILHLFPFTFFPVR
jgi:hypothetical protein